MDIRRILKRTIAEWPTISLLVVSLLVTACGTQVPEKGTISFDEAVSAFHVGLAAVQVGNDQRAAVELEKASDLAPGEPAIWNNLGVLQLRQKDFENAAATLEKARRLAPNNGRIYFNLAILAQQQSNSESLKANLEKVRELDPNDLRPLYLLALEHEKQQKDKDALAAFEAIIKAEPENLAALIESARLKAKLGDEAGLNDTISLVRNQADDWPDEVTIQFLKLKETPVSQAATQIAFLRNVLLRLPEFRSSLDKIKSSDTVLGELMTRPLKLEVPDFRSAEPDGNLEFKTETISDSESNAAKIVFLDGETPTTAFSEESETRVGEVTIPVTFSGSDEIAVLDFDYDYKNDLAFAGKSGFKLFKQGENAQFEDITGKTGISAEVVAGSFNGLWTFDFDNEGDLDLLLGPNDAGPVVLRNKGNGAFEVLRPFEGAEDVIDFEYADLDEDGDSDASLLQNDGKLLIFDNKRGGLFAPPETAQAGGIAAMTVGDLNGDGVIEVIAVQRNGEFDRYSLDGAVASRPSDVGFAKCDSNCELSLGDFDNNGANDVLFTSGPATELLLNFSEGKPVPLIKIDASISNFADLNNDGLLDLIGIDPNGKAAKLTNLSKLGYKWQIVRPKAAKTEGDQRINSFGIGGEIETRAGLAVQKQIIRSPQVHFGLGNAKQTDVIRVVWQNGYVQAEFDIKTNQVVAAEQRLKGSCPHLFAWNGKEFAHVKDAPPWSPALGLKINAQDTYGILQTEEWFKIPGDALKPMGGFYELRITGEYWESFYIDHYRLMVVDHPVDTEVFTDERFSIPLPPLKVFTTKSTKLFESAVDHNGKDVSEIVSSIDEKYLDDIKRGKYQGVAEDHYVELELPDEAPRNKKLWIVAYGWVHPTDASINVQRGQDVQHPPKSLSIEVQDENGDWKTVKDNLGFPAGKMKTVLLDLEGAFRSDTKIRKLRLRTEMEIFWDKLAWAEAIEPNANETNELALDSAELRYRGFSVIEKPDDSSPEVPDYKRVMTTEQRWRDLVGYYTRFGDIKPLLEKTDDRFVLSNAGDEFVLKFPAMPEVKEGYKRDFVIIGNGWIKDGDMNSVFSKTLLPLPTQATNDYTKPPGRLEDDPVYQKNRQDWIDFHTRYVAPDRFRKALRNR